MKTSYQDFISIVEYWQSLNSSLEYRDFNTCPEFAKSVSFFIQTLDHPFFFIDHNKVEMPYACKRVPSYLPNGVNDMFGHPFASLQSSLDPSYYDFVTRISLGIAFDRLYALPKEYRSRVRVFKDYPIKLADGATRWVLHKMNPVDVDSRGGIQLTLHELYDISSIKKGGQSNLILYGEDIISELYSYREEIQECREPLTKRQMEVLSLSGKSYQAKGIAYELGIAPTTVETIRRDILERWGCHDMSSAVALARMMGMM